MVLKFASKTASKKASSATKSKKAAAAASKKASKNAAGAKGAKNAAAPKNAAGAAPKNAAPVNAAAAAAAALAAKRLPEDVYDCRIKKFTAYRSSCKPGGPKTEADAKMCGEIEKRCSQYGVGSDIWPIDFWPKKGDPGSDDRMAKIKATPGYNFGDGRRCMNEIFWEFRPDDLLCGGEKPMMNPRGRSKKGNVARGIGNAGAKAFAKPNANAKALAKPNVMAGLFGNKGSAPAA